MDLDDLEHNTRDGLHLAALAGTWIALVMGFGGMRDSTPVLRFAPRLPRAITRLAFIVTRHGHPLQVTVTPEEVSYRLQDGECLMIEHFGERIELAPDVATTRPVPPAEQHPEPRQPPGREPLLRSAPAAVGGGPDAPSDGHSDWLSEQREVQHGVDGGRDKGSGGQREHPGGDDVAGDAPAHG